MFSADNGLKTALLKEVTDIDHRVRRAQAAIAAMKSDLERRKLVTDLLEKLGEKAPPQADFPAEEKAAPKPRLKTGTFVKEFMSKHPGIGYSVDQIVEGIGWEKNPQNHKLVYVCLRGSLMPDRVRCNTLGLYEWIK
jgi:hypothetical protein